MIALKADEIARLTGGRLVGDGDAVVTGPVVVDSRLVEPGGMFVAFAGEHVDGHDYVARATEAGAAVGGSDEVVADERLVELSAHRRLR